MIAPPTTSPTTRRERRLLAAAVVNGALALALLVLLALPSTTAPSALRDWGSNVEWLGRGFSPHGPGHAPPPSYHELYATSLAHAKYIDLTHPIRPDMPLWPGFPAPSFGPATTADTNEPFTYAQSGFVATAARLGTDQLGTQLDPPAHWNEYGATISDLPPTVAVRPLVVIDIAAKAAADPSYHAQVEDVFAWEAAHGRVPAGSVVFFRDDVGPSAAPTGGIGLAALQFLHGERHILMHGHEALDTDATPTLEGEAWLLHHDYLQAEGVANLALVPQAGCLVSIGFAKVQGGTGGYARYVAICPPHAPHGTRVVDAPGAPLPRQSAPLRRGPDGVMAPSPGATPTVYCAPEHTESAGCPPNGWSEPPL